MAPHSSMLAWRIPGTGEPGGLPSMGRTESDTTEATQQQQQQQHSCAKLLQSRLNLWDCMDCSLPGSSVHRILQATIESPCPPPGDLPESGLKPASPAAPALQADSYR